MIKAKQVAMIQIDMKFLYLRKKVKKKMIKKAKKMKGRLVRIRTLTQKAQTWNNKNITNDLTISN